jgi:hypothetical protein
MKAIQLQQQLPIFWKGIKVKFIDWDSLNFGGKIKIKINMAFIQVDISELSN